MTSRALRCALRLHNQLLVLGPGCLLQIARIVSSLFWLVGRFIGAVPVARMRMCVGLVACSHRIVFFLSLHNVQGGASFVGHRSIVGLSLNLLQCLSVTYSQWEQGIRVNSRDWHISRAERARVMRAKAYLIEILCSFCKELSRFIKVDIPSRDIYPIHWHPVPRWPLPDWQHINDVQLIGTAAPDPRCSASQTAMGLSSRCRSGSKVRQQIKLRKFYLW